MRFAVFDRVDDGSDTAIQPAPSAERDLRTRQPIGPAPMTDLQSQKAATEIGEALT
jgi:hypothetical protein